MEKKKEKGVKLGRSGRKMTIDAKIGGNEGTGGKPRPKPNGGGVPVTGPNPSKKEGGKKTNNADVQLKRERAKSNVSQMVPTTH